MTVAATCRKVCFVLLKTFRKIDRDREIAEFEWMIGHRTTFNRFVRWAAGDTYKQNEWLADDVGDKGFCGRRRLANERGEPTGDVTGVMTRDDLERIGLRHVLNVPREKRYRVVFTENPTGKASFKLIEGGKNAAA